MSGMAADFVVDSNIMIPRRLHQIHKYIYQRKIAAMAYYMVKQVVIGDFFLIFF